MRILLLMMASLSFSAYAQEVKDYTIKNKTNEAERKQILDIARKQVEDDINQSVIFKVNHLKVAENYAWLEAAALAKEGGELKMPNDFYDCCHVEGLFEKKNGKWVVVQFAGFSTDCWYCGIAAQYPQVPKAIFSEAAGMTE